MISRARLCLAIVLVTFAVALSAVSGGISRAWADECPAGGNHDFVGTQLVRATATTEGLRQYTCKKCGYTYTVTVPVTGHIWGDWVVETPATCSSEGLQYRLCTKCGQREDRVIPTLSATGEHTWVESARVNPTCMADGSITYTCSVCGATKTDIVPALGHAWGEWGAVRESTQDEEGLEQRVCANDSSHVETRPIAKLPVESGDDQPETTAAAPTEFFTAGPDNITQVLAASSVIAAIIFIVASWPLIAGVVYLRRQKKVQLQALKKGSGNVLGYNPKGGAQ